MRDGRWDDERIPLGLRFQPIAKNPKRRTVLFKGFRLGDLRSEGLGPKGLGSKGLGSKGLDQKGLDPEGLGREGLGQKSLRSEGLDRKGLGLKGLGSKSWRPGSPHQAMRTPQFPQRVLRPKLTA